MWELLLRRQRSVLDDLGGDTEVADDVASPGGLLSICRDYLGGVDPQEGHDEREDLQGCAPTLPLRP